MARKLTKEQRERFRSHANVFTTGGQPWYPLQPACETISMLDDLDDADAEIERLRKDNVNLKEQFRLLSEYSMKLVVATTRTEIARLKGEFSAKMDALRKEE